MKYFRIQAIFLKIEKIGWDKYFLHLVLLVGSSCVPCVIGNYTNMHYYLLVSIQASNKLIIYLMYALPSGSQVSAQ